MALSAPSTMVWRHQTQILWSVTHGHWLIADAFFGLSLTILCVWIFPFAIRYLRWPRRGRPSTNKAMHTEHAIGGFVTWCFTRACRVMAAVLRFTENARHRSSATSHCFAAHFIRSSSFTNSRTHISLGIGQNRRDYNNIIKPAIVALNWLTRIISPAVNKYETPLHHLTRNSCRWLSSHTTTNTSMSGITVPLVVQRLLNLGHINRTA